MANYCVELTFRLMLSEIGFREANRARNHSQAKQLLSLLTPKMGPKLAPIMGSHEAGLCISGATFGGQKGFQLSGLILLFFLAGLRFT
jgi:hypothetical protein